MTQDQTKPMPGPQKEQDAQDIAGLYQLFAALFRQAPSQAQLDFLSDLDTSAVLASDPLKKAAQVLAKKSASLTPAQINDEFFELFIGLGRGEVVPYASWHLTGSLMEKPLAELRQDLKILGFERQDDVKEPEDSMAAILEVQAYLILDEHPAQAGFFKRHLATWGESLIHEIEKAKSADFYKALAGFFSVFYQDEKLRYTLKLNKQASQQIQVQTIDTHDTLEDKE